LNRERIARTNAEDRASTAAYTDFITGLLNRRGFVLALDSLKDRGPLALAILDLDHFKRVNDTHGHAAGDAILREVGRLLVQLAPDSAKLARLGGDEFAVLLVGTSATRADASDLAFCLLSRLAEPLEAGGLEAQVGVSIGIALSESGHESASTLMRRSDIAMYEAKKAGRNQLAWFSASMEKELELRTKLEADMRKGIAAGEFIPFYQPQVDLVTGKLHGFEVLARWQHPTQGLIEPSNFIPAAEATGMIGSLSFAVMRRALLETLHWDSSLLIAVNLSPVQLKDPLLAQRITKLLVETGFPARRLELEITESSLFDDLDLALTTITSLKNLGITISLDDFGTGYSSLTQLQALPFDRIKIDRSFVLTMSENEESAAIVSAIMSLGASLKLPVTAEGIETDAVRCSLEAQGCAQGQGWHFGRPLPALEAKKLFDQQVATLSGEPDGPHGRIPGAAFEALEAKDRRNLARRGASKRSAA
jgi:diguanylate cyclase (GGDEF)-like protein